MQLINTPIIPSTEDLLWSLPEDLPALENRRLLVLSAPFLPNSLDEMTLQKMMAACKLGEADYAIIQMEPQERLSWQLLSGSGAPRKILLLGVMPTQLGISATFIQHSINRFLGSIFIPSVTLGELEAGKELKRALWEQGLKPIFGPAS